MEDCLLEQKLGGIQDRRVVNEYGSRRLLFPGPGFYFFGFLTGL